MRAVMKYKLELGMNTVNIPGGLSGSSVAPQPGVQGLCQLWTVADTDKPEVPVHILMVGTGQAIPENLDQLGYIGAVLLSGGAMVFHALLVQEKTNG